MASSPAIPVLTGYCAMTGWFRSSLLFFVSLALAAVFAACGSSHDSGSHFVPPVSDASVMDSGPVQNNHDASVGPPMNDSGTLFNLDSSSGDGSGEGGSNFDSAAGFDVEPSTLQTVTVTIGQPIPTVVFTAYDHGQPVPAGWSIDRGNLALIGAGPSTTGTVTPTASAAGLVTVTAGRAGVTLTRQVFIKIVATQNGPNSSAPSESSQIASSPAQLSAGGGVGGVGGEGLGVAVTDPATLTALGNPQNNGQAQGLGFLYPYDGTVWPRGILAPLLQWNWSTGDADAILVQLRTSSGSLSWTGTFGRPAILAVTGGAYIRAPIPQDVWLMATTTAGGAMPTGGVDKLLVSLVVAKGGQAYGPILETWTVAPGLLDGIIYYNSYGTQYAQNSSDTAVGGNHKFGGAVLSIHVGDTQPKLAAGQSGTPVDCRVCHSVAANGSRLVVQHGDNNYVQSSNYDLTVTGNVEHVMTNSATYPAVYPDGSLALTSGGLLLPLPNDATPLPVSGLSTFSTELGSPSFSPDGKSLVMNPMSGAGVTTPTQQLWVASFAKSTGTFSHPVLVVDDTGKPAQTRPGWGAFLPDGASIVFQHQSVAGLDGNGAGQLLTRKGTKAQIGWTSATDASHVTALNALNGLSASGTAYVPKLATPMTLTCTADGQTVGTIDPDHGDDVDLNYEPTVSPVASGGYAWVVFTSRRMYGSVANIPPFCSDPRGVDLVQHVTTKKLWVAAIDVNAKPGTDASHPAFYLPAQELLAGNSRGFWTLDPCRADGQSCMTGDQCCNGYCEQASPDAGVDAGLVCGNKPPNASCAPEGDKCTSTADCCSSMDTCINGFCEPAGPPQ
jgi:hypothetical protein